MATNKRKTLMIKRPSPNESDKPRPKPKANDAVGATDSESLKPVAAESAGGASSVADNKGATARISLPDEAKIRKARRADDSGDKLPKAPELMDAENNATRQIEIDTIEVTRSDNSLQIDDSGSQGNNDQTMQINSEALETGEVKPVTKIDVDALSQKTEEATRVSTGKIPAVEDDEIRKISSPKEQLDAAEAELNAANNDQTMEIDAEALKTGKIEKQVFEEDERFNDQTMQIDPNEFNETSIEEKLEEAEADLDNSNDQTMEIDADAFRTGKIEKQDLEEAGKPDPMSLETMQMDSIEDEFNAATAEMQLPEEKADGNSFNAATMAMDPNELARELEKDKTQPSPVSDEERNQTMDLSDVKPKTILIKRPSQNEAPSAPTVKTVRPDAQTVRTSRPTDGAAASGASDGKTVKLRRPGGAGPRPGAPVSRVAANAGLELSEDGNVAVKAKTKGTSLGAAWLALSIVTLVIMCGALWIALAINMPELPMPGRLVNELDQILPLS